jgi:phosphate-selective porin OprO/OprP
MRFMKLKCPSWLALLLAGGGWVTTSEALNIFPDPSQGAPEPGKLEAVAVPNPIVSALLPDLSTTMKEQLTVKEAGFTLIPSLILLADYTTFQQDEANVEQVGIQDSAWEARAMRVILRGTVGSSYKVRYLVAGEYKGLSLDDRYPWLLVDAAVSFPLTSSERTRLEVGKMKEAFAYEMVGDAANLPHQERVLSPFFQSRNVGAQVTHLLENQRMTFRAGVFNDSRFETGTYSGGDWQVTGRMTGLVWDNHEHKHFLHLGLAGRYNGAQDDLLRYRGRPESNVADNFADTGRFAADHAAHLGLEALWNRGPFSLLGEYTQAWVSSPSAGDPTFKGWYVTASWVLTGETRPYDRTVGYARRVIPKSRWGAPELVARFAHVDLADGVVDGGEFDRVSLGLNWWASQRWKLGVTWGRTWLDAEGIEGEADSFLARVQWIF